MLTIVAAAIAVTTFILLRTVLSAWHVASQYAAKDRIATRNKIGYVMTLPRRSIEVVRAVEGVKQATHMNWFGGRYAVKPDTFFSSMAVDPQSFLRVMEEIVLTEEERKRWLEDKQGAIIGDQLATSLGLKVGDRITLSGTIYPGDWQFNVAGIYSANRKSVDRSTLWFHWSYLNDRGPLMRRDQIGWITSRLDDPGRSSEIASAIDAIFDVQDPQTASMSERQMNLSFLGMFSAVLRALDIISIIIMVSLTVLLGNALAMSVRDRTREYGVLAAIGFEPRHIRLLVFAEAVGLACVAALLGIAMAYPIVELGMGRFLEENMSSWFPYFRIDGTTYAAAVLLPALIAVIASSTSAFRAGHQAVHQALRRVA